MCDVPHRPKQWFGIKSKRFLLRLNKRLLLPLLLVTGLSVVFGGHAPGQFAVRGASWDAEWAWHRAERMQPEASVQPHTSADSLQLARAEVALGRARRARPLLEPWLADSSLRSDPRVQGLAGDLLLLEDRPTNAARYFSSAALHSAGVQRGIWHARAGAAFEAAGELEAAAAQYREARTKLPTIEGWLAIREARVTADPNEALKLLRRAPPEAQRLVTGVRGRAQLAAGDSTAAIRSFAAANDDTAAARIALILNDTARARRFAYSALQSSDTAMVAAALRMVESALPPRLQSERIQIARAMVQTRRARDARRILAQTVDDGDTSAATLLLYGTVLEDLGDRAKALTVYARARSDGSSEARVAAYRYARLLRRVGRREDGYRALLQFAREFPERSEAPLAVFLVADARADAGRRREADSLLIALAEGWPRDAYASRARITLATDATRRGDMVAAEGWYQAEIAARGVQRSAAFFFAGRLRATRGDSVGARALWLQVAELDSLGYYGSAARTALGLPALRVPPSTAPQTAVSVRASLQRLDLLRSALPNGEEVAELIRVLMAQDDRPVPELLDLAEGFIERGWVSQGIRLGWQAAQRHTMHDPRVLRVIYPWPYESLIREEAKKFDLDPYLITALIRQESSFLAEVTSRAGARGLMQLMPSTATYVARRIGVSWSDAFLGVPDANVHVGTAHLSALMRQYDRELIPALAAYNAGGRPVSRWLRYPEAGDPYAFVERIPYVETRNYVKIVLRNRELYRALYPPNALEEASSQ